jgi:hypothetical protein
LLLPEALLLSEERFFSARIENALGVGLPNLLVEQRFGFVKERPVTLGFAAAGHLPAFGLQNGEPDPVSLDHLCRLVSNRLRRGEMRAATQAAMKIAAVLAADDPALAMIGGVRLQAGSKAAVSGRHRVGIPFAIFATSYLRRRNESAVRQAKRLNERGLRRLAAAEAIAAGRCGVSAVMRATGLARR